MEMIPNFKESRLLAMKQMQNSREKFDFYGVAMRLRRETACFYQEGVALVGHRKYQCLPFGISSAPRAFTKLLKPVVATLRSAAIRLVIYLDDLLLLHHNAAELQKVFQLVTTLLRT